VLDDNAAGAAGAGSDNAGEEEDVKLPPLGFPVPFGDDAADPNRIVMDPDDNKGFLTPVQM
jgi:hypothetical protein